MVPTTKTIKDLKGTLGKIEGALKHVAHIDDVYWQVIAIIENNPGLKEGGIFQEWLVYTYIDSIIIRLRRLSDQTKKTISLWHLLEDLKNIKPEIAEEVNSKQEELISSLKPVLPHANRIIAHYGIKEPISELKYKDVRVALVNVFRIFNWCALKLEEIPLLTPVPTIQENWLAVFKEPWLKDFAPPLYIHLNQLLREKGEG